MNYRPLTPTKITLELLNGYIQLRIDAPQTENGYTVMESVPFKTGDALPSMRKQASKYAKQFNIPFVDTITQ
ncbi:hypothetical protein [Phyllobacterium chamaecytisi]|uniref:hypothetical protein n=1 Tax=Phyllobacterium chamaecytisi TaxID=2876082 RepID=UPI001CCDFDE9|nr:hypothetical protein [Phyllobacterium sp. KW56]MBZ9600721.1 hypothetical protein [Phyllobacterium sp. KW56]